MAGETQPSSSSKPVVPQSPTRFGQNLATRLIGVVILLFEFAFLFVYGFKGAILNEITSWPTVSNSLVFSSFFAPYNLITLIFILVGFGCLYNSMHRVTLTGFFTALFITSFTTLLSPLLQKWWFNVFTGGFNSSFSYNASQVGGDDYKHYLTNNPVQVSFYVLKIAQLNIISQLVVFYGVMQKLHTAQLFVFSIFYQIFWTLNFHLCAQVSLHSPDGQNRIFDDYQIAYTYLFSSVFGVILCLILKKPPSFDSQIKRSSISELISMVGCFFIFIGFAASTAFYPIKSPERRYVWPEAFQNILFALSSSVLCTCAFSILFRGKIGAQQVTFGMIGGAILSGPFAGTMDNIGSYMALGLIAALINVVYYTKIYPKINASTFFDVNGIIYILIISFLATFIISPFVIRGMYTKDVTSTPLNNVEIDSAEISGYLLGYVGITVGIALVSGAVTGGILKCLEREVQHQFDDRVVFDPSSGLNDNSQGLESRIHQEAGQSASNLNHP